MTEQSSKMPMKVIKELDSKSQAQLNEVEKAFNPSTLTIPGWEHFTFIGLNIRSFECEFRRAGDVPTPIIYRLEAVYCAVNETENELAGTGHYKCSPNAIDPTHLTFESNDRSATIGIHIHVKDFKNGDVLMLRSFEPGSSFILYVKWGGPNGTTVLAEDNIRTVETSYVLVR